MKAIVFDAFGTLFQVTSGGSARSIMEIIARHGGAVDETAFPDEWKRYYKEHTGEGAVFQKEREIFIARIGMFFERFGVEESAVEAADALLAGAFERKAYPEAKAVIEKLRKKYSVFIASNTDNDVLESVMRKNGLCADGVFTSEDLKCYKPNPAFYRFILRKTGLSPEDVLFVGDSPADDVLGPRNAGMKTAWLDRKGAGGDFGQDLTIADLGELSALA